MARKYNQVTEMGKLMDPIADKLLTCGAMIVCSAFGELGWWVTILFLIREIGITVMRFFVMERPGGKVIAAAWPGKLKTVFQCVGLSMLLLPFWSLGNGQATPFWMTAYYFLTYAIIYVHWSCASTRVRVPVQHVRRPEAEVTDIPMRELCDSLAAGILKICEANNTKIACAESLTGGLLADAFVRIPGASNVLLGSAVTYDINAKLDPARGQGPIGSRRCRTPRSRPADGRRYRSPIQPAGIRRPNHRPFHHRRGRPRSGR